jgi:hypothetical protein
MIFVCEFEDCDKEFDKLSKLRTHERVHRNEVILVLKFNYIY